MSSDALSHVEFLAPAFSGLSARLIYSLPFRNKKAILMPEAS
jgi:hypothetical protein